jgi:metal-dependent amidase/aminoacylase/carboxypeptidase family protein
LKYTFEINKKGAQRVRISFNWLAAAIATIFLALPASVIAEDNGTAQSEENDVLKRVTYDIKYLASDELGGRKPGTEGIEKAAKHIEEVFKAIGLKTLENGTYRQDFEVRQGRTIDADSASMKIVGSGAKEMTMELELGKDYMPQATRRKFELDAELVFVGYGINAEDDLNYNEYRGVDVDGKIVVLIRREPQQNDENSVFEGTNVSRHSYIRTKTRAAKDAGAVGVIMVNDGVNASDEEKDILEEPTRFSTTFPFVQIKRKVLNQMLENTPLTNADGKKLSSLSEIEELIDETLSPISQPLKGWKATCTAVGKNNMATTSNIVGIIEGKGPHADETIVIGGHYDHLGMGGMGSRTNRREIHNGADDNATGTAAVMELARRFAKRDEKPSRRLVFIAFSAEEMGLLGAKYYVDDDPLYALDKTAAMVNFDMIGWLRDDKITIYNANSATEFETLLDRANKEMGMDIEKSAGFGGSDHLPFFQKEIPVMFIHTGLTSTYHTPEDDFETIDCEGAVKVIDYSEKVVDELLALDTKPTFQSGRSSARQRRIRLGVSLDEDVENGVKITRILEGSIADKNGFKVDDVITAIGVDKTDKRREVNRLIRENAGKTVMFKLRRGTEQVETLVELKRPDEEKKEEEKKEEGENKG